MKLINLDQCILVFGEPENWSSTSGQGEVNDFLHVGDIKQEDDNTRSPESISMTPSSAASSRGMSGDY